MNLKQMFVTKASAFLLLLTAPVLQAATISLDFNSLPSAQGWEYGACLWGCYVPSESSAFSVNGTQLTHNSMGTGQSISTYEMKNIIDPNLPFTILLTARVLQSEVTGLSLGRATAFWAYAETGSERFGFSLNTTTFSPDAGTGSSTYLPIDATQFHNYRVEAIPGISNGIYVDNVLFSSQLPTRVSSQNILALGNSSSYENSFAEITQYSFIQNPVPVPAAFWLLGSGLVTLLGLPKIRRRVLTT